MLGLGIRISGTVVGGVIGLAAIWALVLVFYDIPSDAKMLKASAHHRALQ